MSRNACKTRDGSGKSRSKFFKGVVLLLITSLLSACMVNQPIPPYADTIKNTVTPGTSVRVVTRDSLQRAFVVREVTDDGLVGDDDNIAYPDIKSIESQKIDAGKTGMFVLAGVGVVVLVGYLLFLATGPDIEFNMGN